MMKTCSVCKTELPLEAFYKKVSGKYGVAGTCKNCHKLLANRKYRSSDEYRKSIQDRAREYSRTHCNKEYLKEYRSRPKIKEAQKRRMKVYRNRPEIKELLGVSSRAWKRKQWRTNINYKLKQNLRGRLWAALKGRQKMGSAVIDLGCSIEELKIYLESQFKEGMTWENYGKWHVDHIYPLSKVDLTDREQFLKVCHFTNLQPLWSVENRLKSNKISSNL
jgi:hypothetical protein